VVSGSIAVYRYKADLFDGKIDGKLGCGQKII
jgi:hypothetical protein